MTTQDPGPARPGKRRVDVVPLTAGLLLGAFVVAAFLANPPANFELTEYNVPAWTFIVGLALVSLSLIVAAFFPPEVTPRG